MTRFGDGPRRRRMIRGTIARIGELAMRYGHRSQLATLDCTSSRRSTVMCALPRATAVTTVYQRDSSSKRPRSSVVSAARVTDASEVPRGGHGLQGFAPCGRRLRRPWTPRPPRGRRRLCQQADACSAIAKPPSKDRGLDRGSFHISAVMRRRAPFEVFRRPISFFLLYSFKACSTYRFAARRGAAEIGLRVAARSPARRVGADSNDMCQAA